MRATPEQLDEAMNEAEAALADARAQRQLARRLLDQEYLLIKMSQDALKESRRLVELHGEKGAYTRPNRS